MSRQVDPAERRTVIVEAAFDILARRGLPALTMRAVAEVAGVTTGMVTHWFESRDALIQAAIETAARREERRAARATKGGADLKTTLVAFLPLDHERADEFRVWIGFWAASIGNDRLLEGHRQRYRDWARYMAEVGLVADERVARRLIAIVDGISIDAVLDPERWPAEEQLAALAAFTGDAIFQDAGDTGSAIRPAPGSRPQRSRHPKNSVGP